METPAVYFGKQGKGIWKSKEEFSNPYNWSGYVVGQILTKPEYMGHILPFRMFSHRTMKPIGRSCEQGITGGNLSGFAARQIFHRKAHTVHLLKNQYHENMEVKS